MRRPENHPAHTIRIATLRPQGRRHSATVDAALGQIFFLAAVLVQSVVAPQAEGQAPPVRILHPHATAGRIDPQQMVGLDVHLRCTQAAREIPDHGEVGW
ncbi:MAG TPA: hypothetical protein VGV37_06125 [Aliidongia sp.]|uniref:hypothetical protein n=1 Tax=Aliidongia sp. TaxID=1914230 RepID=UPI002DDCD4BA|nr:hypothetical protein [Aliidongia sp.]HEV2674101.1 hypothetical protein [Aliidongia sp.]